MNGKDIFVLVVLLCGGFGAYKIIPLISDDIDQDIITGDIVGDVKYKEQLKVYDDGFEIDYSKGTATLSLRNIDNVDGEVTLRLYCDNSINEAPKQTKVVYLKSGESKDTLFEISRSCDPRYKIDAELVERN